MPKKFKQRYNKNQGCLEKIENSYDKNQVVVLKKIEDN